MSTAQKKRVGIVFACLLLVGAAICLSLTHSLTAAQHAAKGSRVKELRKEKLAILQEFAASLRRSYNAGDRPLTDLLEGDRALHNAELDLCETNAERIAVLEKMLANAKELEQNIAVLVKQALRADVELMKAKVCRLDAEIALEQAQQQ